MAEENQWSGGEKVSLSKNNFVIHVQPSSDGISPEWIIMRETDAAKVYQHAFPERNYIPEQALDDYMVVNWATKLDAKIAKSLFSTDAEEPQAQAQTPSQSHEQQQG